MKIRFFPYAVFLVFTAFSHESSAQLQDDDSNSVLGSIWGKSFDPWADPASNDFAPASPGDTDLGEQLVLMPAQEYLPFSLELTENVRWTSNAGLSDLDVRTELEDIYSITDLYFSYLPQIGDNSYFEINMGYAIYRYMDYSSLNFDRVETSLGMIHNFRELNDLIAWTRLKHYRILSSSGHEDLFTDYNLELGLYYPIPLNSRHKAFGSFSSKFSLDADPGSVRRHEHSLSGGYTFTPADRFEISAYFGLNVYDYLENGRSDLLYNTGLALTSHLTDKIDAVISANYSWNDSNTAGFDYEVADIGAKLGLTMKF
ncbi:MAG: hypothetical protein ACSHX9_14850 [Luteolibacter sp.]